MSSLSIKRIDRREGFGFLKEPWERVYASDPHARIFQSWDWMDQWLQINNQQWTILAAYDHEDETYVGFFPFTRPKSNSLSPIRIISMSGNPVSPYAGFLCKPERQEESIAVWADYLKNSLAWEKLIIKGMIDERAALFEEQFVAPKFKVYKYPGNNSLVLSLPDSWDEYLRKTLGKSTRKTLIRLSNRASEENIVLRTSTSETIDNDVEMLLKLVQNKWGQMDTAEDFKKMLLHFFSIDRLLLNFLLDGRHPVSAQACLLDESKKNMYAYITTFDPRYSRLSPGNVVGLHSIQKAIESGYQNYDFLLGTDPYKVSLKASEKFVHNFTIERQGLRTKLNKILKRSF